MDGKLPKITLGNTGKRISRLALGGFHQVEISSEIVAEVIDTYIEAGGNYIETARGYGAGAAEVKIGRALEGRRDEVVLCSKSGAAAADDMKRDLEASLENLKTDRIEFYYLHGLADSEKMDRVLAPGGALEALEAAKEEGTIDGIGLSSHRPWIYTEAFDRLPIDLILIWSNFLEDCYVPEISRDIIPQARAKGIGITAMKPLADGFLYRSAGDAMRYALGSGAEVLVCGMNSSEHVRQAVEAVCDGAADETERAEILRRAPELGRYVCRQCGMCSDRLEELFRLEGYVDRQMIDYLEHDPADYALRLRLAGWFSLADTARKRFSSGELDRDALLEEASDVSCPYGIDVPRKVRLAWAKLAEEDVRLL